MTRKLYGFWLVVLLCGLVLSTACGSGSDDDDDDDDGGNGSVPDEVNEFLDNEDFATLRRAGMPINEGLNPPNIEDSYRLNSLITTYDEQGMEGYQPSEYVYTFYDQTGDLAIKMDYYQPSGMDEGNGVGGFISGQGDCFTLYFDTSGVDQDCDYTAPTLISGCMGGDGIEGWTFGFMFTSKNGACDHLIPVDSPRILEEEDNLAAYE